MRILANENIGGLVVDGLRKEGHDVIWMRTQLPGSSDRFVLELAQREARILITFDKDFGELAFRSRLPASSFLRRHSLSNSYPVSRSYAKSSPYSRESST